MGSRLTQVALVIVLAVVLVPARDFLLLGVALLLGDLVHCRRLGCLILGIEFLFVLCHAAAPLLEPVRQCSDTPVPEAPPVSGSCGLVRAWGEPAPQRIFGDCGCNGVVEEPVKGMKFAD